ncbi:putative GPI anchored protein [Aspergillus undulatus]|uniref:putative GPI anchored protein n=1 Tax=Aspergillus undulatus TaxID=1810928 RepID=UPI003CCD5215
MKFSFAAAALFAGAAFASVHGGEAETPQQQYTTVEVTEYTTYCPKSTTLTAGTETIPVETPGTVTLSNGPYTVTRPLITSTITHCKACSSSATPTWAPSSSVPVIPTGTSPVIPTDVAPTGGASSSTTPAPPTFTGGASRAAAGAGAVAGLFGVVAALL